MKNLTYTFLLISIISGCARNQQMIWSKPNAQQGEFEQVRYECLKQSQQYSSSAFISPNPALKGYEGLSRSGMGTNDQLFGACMNAKGWFIQKVLPIKPVNNSTNENMPTDLNKTLTHSLEAIQWNEKSVSSANIGNWVESIRTASVAISLDSTFTDAYINRCRAYIAYGDLNEATKDCEEALKIEPNNMMALNNLAVISINQGDETKALLGYQIACLGGLQLSCENFKKIKGYAPNDTIQYVTVKNQEAIKSFSQKKWNEVISITSEIISTAPENPNAYITRSGAYANIGKVDEGLSDVDTAIRLNPNDSVAYNNRGYIYELKKNKSQAILQYEISCNLKYELGCKNLSRIKQN